MLLHQPAVTNRDPEDFNDQNYFGFGVLSAPVDQRTSLPDAYQFYTTNAWLFCEDGDQTVNTPMPSSEDLPETPDSSECLSGLCADLPAVPFPPLQSP